MSSVFVLIRQVFKCFNATLSGNMLYPQQHCDSVDLLSIVAATGADVGEPGVCAGRQGVVLTGRSPLQHVRGVGSPIRGGGVCRAGQAGADAEWSPTGVYTQHCLPASSHEQVYLRCRALHAGEWCAIVHHLSIICSTKKETYCLLLLVSFLQR